MKNNKLFFCAFFVLILSAEKICFGMYKAIAGRLAQDIENKQVIVGDMSIQLLLTYIVFIEKAKKQSNINDMSFERLESRICVEYTSSTSKDEFLGEKLLLYVMRTDPSYRRKVIDIWGTDYTVKSAINRINLAYSLIHDIKDLYEVAEEFNVVDMTYIEYQAYINDLYEVNEKVTELDVKNIIDRIYRVLQSFRSKGIV